MINSNPSSYQPQSRDTSPEIDKFLMLAFRQAKCLLGRKRT